MKPKAELVFLSGDRTGEVVPLEQGRTVIGRQVGDLIISDKEVSSIHAIISFERGGWYVMDLGSTNGVFVDGQVKLEARLRSGVELRVGQTALRFQALSGEESEAEPPPDLLADGLNADLTLPHVPRGGTMTSDQAAQLRKELEQDDALGAMTEQVPSTQGRIAAVLTADDDDLDQVAAESGRQPSTGAGLGVQVTLEIMEGADKGAVRRFNQESVLIGRLNTDMVVRDSDVSRRHSIIEVFDASQIYLRDLNSTNGSFVNGRRVSSVRLRNGDQIRLGRSLVRFSTRPL